MKKIYLFLIYASYAIAGPIDLTIRESFNNTNFDEILSLLAPTTTHSFTKIRLGRNYDGRYIVPKELLSKAERCYTYGAGNDISFETELKKLHPDLNIHIYDHTVDYPSIIQPGIFFKKEGIAPGKTEDKNSLTAHLMENGDTNKKIILKLDIEGAEWPVVHELADEYLKNNVVVLIIELHWFKQVENAEYYLTALKKIHENLPTDLDMTNCPGAPDETINYWNKI